MGSKKTKDMHSPPPMDVLRDKSGEKISHIEIIGGISCNTLNGGGSACITTFCTPFLTSKVVSEAPRRP